MKNRLILVVIFLLNCASLLAQVRVAVTDFTNRASSLPYLNQYEEEIPEFIKTSLSKSNEIELVERQDLEKIMTEQALSLSGLIDSANAQEVGKLVEAEYIISGYISLTGDWFRIDAKIIRIETGLVINEMVRSKSSDNMSEMAELLSNNIRYRLTGENPYKEKITLRTYPTIYFLSATVLGAAATTYSHVHYLDERQKYRNATALDDFDRLYKSANRWNKTRYILATATGAAFLGSFYCWIKNLSPNEIQTAGLPVTPYIAIPDKGEYAIGLQIQF